MYFWNKNQIKLEALIWILNNYVHIWLFWRLWIIYYFHYWTSEDFCQLKFENPKIFGPTMSIKAYRKKVKIKKKDTKIMNLYNTIYGYALRRNTGLDWGAGEGGRCRAFITDNFKSARHKKELKVARCRWEIILPNGNYSHSSDMGDNRALINSFIHFFSVKM